MVLFIYEKGSENYMNKKNEFVISKDVIDECLADSIEKKAK
ncbi:MULTISPECIES: hypothetical protein [Clostridium]|mgnify:CR=1 FL=1|uniref:Uncharacterized protein n=1 Tax=Clostridium frigoriphilum TaxID=443253 RepID=A0ABU7UH93_9CLOT|nr:hypothetical protein [Clostridium sp. DSM 17811]